MLGVAGESGRDEVATAPLDQALLLALADTVEDATTAFADFDYARALERSERFFWGFCDDYVELVKQRAYSEGEGDGAASARATLRIALESLLRLFAPHLPFVTEEVWSWWRDGSVHRAPWPDAGSLRASGEGGDPAVYEVAAQVVGEVRKAKTVEKRSLRTDATRVVVHDSVERLAALEQVTGDVQEAARVHALESVPGDSFRVEVELAPDPGA